MKAVMSELKYVDTLVATLGGQPQVVTFTLDLLLQRGIPIREVIVIHPHPSEQRLQDSLDLLNAEFISDHYEFDGHLLTCHFRTKVLELNNQPLDDIFDRASVQGTRQTIYQFIQELKRQPRHIHLSVSGGRRLMSFLAISAAQLKFDAFDHIWHIYTPEKVKDEAKNGMLMHVLPSAGVRLIEVPFFTLGDYLLNAASTVTTDNVQAVEHTQKDHMDAQERKRCDHVVDKATRRQLDVLKAFARGLRPQEVAEELCISIKTVHTHKDALLSRCSEVWELPDDRSFAYRFLQRKFATYFQTNR